jgi:hypothetical protein
MAKFQLGEGEKCESARKEFTQLQNALLVKKLKITMCPNESLDQGVGH